MFRTLGRIACVTVCGVALLGLCGCPKKNEDKASNTSATSSDKSSEKQTDKKDSKSGSDDKKLRVEEKYGFTTESGGG